MLRKYSTIIGNFILEYLTFRNLLVFYGVLGIGTIIRDLRSGESTIPKSSVQIIQETFFNLIFIILLFIIFFLFCRGLGKVLRMAGDYYPDWYYFPKIGFSINKTSDDIEVQFTNPIKRQLVSLQVRYSSLESEKKPLHFTAIQTTHMKDDLLVPTTTLKGKESISITIGRVIGGSVIISTGAINKIKLTRPNNYEYKITISGTFKKRIYRGGVTISISINEDLQVFLREKINLGRNLYINH